MASRDVSRRQDQYKGKAQFKNDELRRRREEAQVEIRRQKRDESMAKRRNLNVASQGGMTDGDTDEEEVNGGLLEKQVSDQVVDLSPLSSMLTRLLLL
jgi:importin subunit alpha-1